ncbi:hypothetical protein EMCRGX_G009887 [Ephydatia muelleri]
MQKLHLLPPLKVAEELLLIDSSALRKIQPDELADEAWVGKRKDELSPNITAMVRHFNSLAMLIPTEILAETTPQMRAKVISTFIKVAEACHQLKNYHSLKAVLAGLQCTPVYRLRKTWKKVPSIRIKMFQKLSTLMAEEGNCALYHKKTRKNIEKEVPFVPYLGFFLTQIVHQTCHQQMNDKQAMDLRRRGAVLKRHPPIFVSCPNEDIGIASSAPSGHMDTLSPKSCSMSCSPTDSTTTSSFSFTSYDAMIPLSSERGAISLNTNEDFFNDSSTSSLYDLPVYSSLSLHPPSVCSTSFSSSPCGMLQPHPLPKCHSAEPLCPHSEGTTHAYKPPVSPTSSMTLEMSLSSEDLDAKLDLKCHQPHQPGDEGSSLCRFADSGVCLNESNSSLRGGLCYCGSPPLGASADWHQLERRPATTLGCVDLKHLFHNPKELLSRYQISSLSCGVNVQSKEDIRNLISNHHCNTEMENYVLSYQREPQ